LPILLLLWIPGIVGVTSAPDARVWGCPLLWWSIYLTVLWCGWWGALAAAMLAPHVLYHTLGVVAPELKHYIAYLSNVKRFAALAGWGLCHFTTPCILYSSFGLQLW